MLSSFPANRREANGRSHVIVAWLRGSRGELPHDELDANDPALDGLGAGLLLPRRASGRNHRLHVARGRRRQGLSRRVRQGEARHQGQRAAPVDRRSRGAHARREEQSPPRRHLGLGGDADGRSAIPGNGRAVQAGGNRQGQCPVQGSGRPLVRDDRLFRRLLREYRSPEEEQPADADVVAGPAESGLQGADRDAQRGELRHRLRAGREHPADEGRREGLAVPQGSRQEHRAVHQVRLAAVQGGGDRRVRDRHLVRVQRASSRSWKAIRSSW